MKKLINSFKHVINNYKNLMEKYILIKLGTILLVLFLLTQIATAINNINKAVTNKNPVSQYNTYSVKSTTVEDVAQRYFNEYMILLKYDPELACSMLDESIKDRYAELSDFKEYIKKIDVDNAVMTDYNFTTDECKRYTINDNFNNTYIFVVESANKYSVIL